MDLAELLRELDQALKAGRGDWARTKLSDLKIAAIPRRYQLQAARIYRRCKLPLQALRVLNPVVRPKGRLVTRASQQELAEYATSLQRVGAFREADGILEKLDGRALPDVSLFRAFGSIARWDYRSALPQLMEYLRNDLPMYERLVGEANLLSCHVFLGMKAEAELLVPKLLAELERQQSWLLLATVLELQAQLEYGQGRYSRALQILAKAQRLL